VAHQDHGPDTPQEAFDVWSIANESRDLGSLYVGSCWCVTAVCRKLVLVTQDMGEVFMGCHSM
jgi:hypothetical protein